MSISKYDNAFKQKVLLKGIDKKVSLIKRDNYRKVVNHRVVNEDGEYFCNIVSSAWEDMLKPYKQGYNMIDCANRILESKQRKSKKVRSKIAKLVLSDNAIFITLTFNDKTLAKTTDLKRRRLVQRYLKENCKDYVANVDYGALKGREHYHAVVSKEIDFSKWYKYGAIKVERVRPLEDSTMRISRYITKLTNHALKVGAIAPRLIYSRNTL